jgi:HlyD family secretion protein
MTRPTFRLVAIAALAAAMGLSACGPKATPDQTGAAQARTVRVVRVESRAITGSLAASGDLVPREEAAVLPEVTGYRVARVLVDVGAHVRRGQVLAELDGDLLHAELERQKALTAQTEAQAAQAEDQAARVAGLDDRGVLSQEEIAQRRFQARAARATAAAQAASLQDVRTRAGKLAVSAPVAGLVLERTVRPGDLSAQGSTPWFRIARDSEVELEAQLAEDGLSKLRPGQRAEVSLPDGVETTGTIRLISPQIDPQTKLGKVRVRLPVRADIRAGGFGRAVFNDVSRTAPAVPETAVRYDADGASVMVVGADNRVKQTPVQTGQRGSGLVELVRGPPAGSRVVLSAAAFLVDGDNVRPVEASTAAAPAKRPTP